MRLAASRAGDKGAFAVDGLHQSAGLQFADCLAHRDPADTKAFDQRRFGRQSIAGSKRARQDVGAYCIAHLRKEGRRAGQPRRRAAGCRGALVVVSAADACFCHCDFVV
jgi:hypothetical protein